MSELWEAGTSGISEELGGLRAFFEDSILREALQTRLSRPFTSFRREAEIDWAAATRAAFPPLLVGKRFYLAPPWCEDPTPTGRLRLVINPGMACGTGQHPCTQLCLEAMERTVRLGDRVLDVGSGSGILSKAALLLGAELVAGCDIDSEVMPMFVGSAAAVRSGSMDVILANISAAAIEDLAGEFLRVGRPGGTLILSGFTTPEIPSAFPVRELLQMNEWACLIATCG